MTTAEKTQATQQNRAYPAAVNEGGELMRKVMGGERMLQIFAECLQECGFENVAHIYTAERLMRFALALSRRGGLPELVGRNLKVRAILGGAKVAPNP